MIFALKGSLRDKGTWYLGGGFKVEVLKEGLRVEDIKKCISPTKRGGDCHSPPFFLGLQTIQGDSSEKINFFFP